MIREKEELGWEFITPGKKLPEGWSSLAQIFDSRAKCMRYPEGFLSHVG
jgi:hypothetical protein